MARQLLLFGVAVLLGLAGVWSSCHLTEREKQPPTKAPARAETAVDAELRLIDVVRLRANRRDREALRAIEAKPLPPPLDLAAGLLQGELHERLGNAERAHAAFQQAVDRYPREGVPLLRLGTLSLRRGDTATAERLLRRALELTPLSEAAYELGSLAGALGRPSDARSSWALAVAWEGNEGHWNQLSRRRLAEATGELTDTDGDTMAQAIKRADDEAGHEAVADLERHSFSEGHRKAAFALRGLLAEQFDDAAALRAYEAGRTKHRNDPSLCLRLAVLSYRRGDVSLARQLLLRSWAHAKLPEAAYHLGAIEAAEQREGAGRIYHIWAAVLESDGGTWRRLAEGALSSP